MVDPPSEESSLSRKAILPDLEILCVQTSLYARFVLRSENQKVIRQLRYGKFQFDAHCIYCGNSSTFKTTRKPQTLAEKTPDEDLFDEGIFLVELKCARRGHAYTFAFAVDINFESDAFESNICKIGQWPSLEDVAGADLDKFRKILEKSRFSELRKASGLYAHGIGIGSFVYLRRIFEGLIYSRYEAFEKAGGAVQDFAKLRMDEKIKALERSLPAAVVKFRAAYKILSTGIHELNEDECLRYFPAVKTAVLQMLEQDWEARERERADRELEDQIAEINRTLRERKKEEDAPDVLR